MGFWDLVDKAGRKVLGRSNAGTASIVARSLRIGAAVIGTGIVIGSCIATGGFAVPFWALGALGGTMLINGAAIPLSWTGNHMKVLQYEDAQAEELADINTLQNNLGQTSQAPDVKLAERLMAASRKASDINGVGGSVLSLISGAASVGLYTPAAPIAAGIMIASRASAAISAGISVPITRNRIAVHKEKLAERQAIYRDLSAKVDSAKATKAHSVVDSVFNNLGIKRDGYLNEWLNHYLYKAVYSHPLFNSATTDRPGKVDASTAMAKITKALENIAREVIERKDGVCEVSKSRLQTCDNLGEYSSEEGFWIFRKHKLASLDAMQVIGKKAQDAMSEALTPSSHAESIATVDAVIANLNLDPNDATTKQLKQQVRVALIECYSGIMLDNPSDDERMGSLRIGLIEATKRTLEPYIKRNATGYATIDKAALVKTELPQGATKKAGEHHHGDDSGFRPHHHMAMLSNKVKEALLEYSSPDIAHKKVMDIKTIADKVISNLHLNPDNFYTQQFYTNLVLSLKSKNLPVDISVDGIAATICAEVSKHTKSETTRPARNFFRETETGYCVFDKESIKASSTATADEKKVKDFKYTAFNEMMQSAFAKVDPASVARECTPPHLPLKEESGDSLFVDTHSQQSPLVSPDVAAAAAPAPRRSFVEMVQTTPHKRIANTHSFVDFISDARSVHAVGLATFEL